MALDLSTLPLEELLKKFGAGGHKPGSGSAAALLGLISCALTKTVVILSKRRDEYKEVWDKLDSVAASITDDIEPALRKAFGDDSSQFNEVINARRARDKEPKPSQRWEHARRALDELYGAIEIPLVVAAKCLLLAEHAIAVFNIGFHGARGDSEVAIESALSGATGAISIVYLNLSRLDGQARAGELLHRAEGLEKHAQRLATERQTQIEELRSTAKAKNESIRLNLNVIRCPHSTESKHSNSDIEAIARNVQNELWINRADIWPGRDNNNTIPLLDPPTAFRVFGYRFETLPTLGEHNDGGDRIEVAGYINKPDRYAAVSKRFPPVVQRFTAAHELGHLVLHKADEQFRDRSLDGSIVRDARSKVEYEADKFAAYFLMPQTVMREVFSGLFGSEQFVVSDNTAFALGAKNGAQLLRECPTMRDLSLRLAKAGMYASRPVRSLAEVFSVSYEAMAIRIEELQMIDFNGYG